MVNFEKNNTWDQLEKKITPVSLENKRVLRFELSSDDQKILLESLSKFGCGWICLSTPNENINLHFILSAGINCIAKKIQNIYWFTLEILTTKNPDIWLIKTILVEHLGYLFKNWEKKLYLLYKWVPVSFSKLSMHP